jgi:hypothetical protein
MPLLYQLLPAQHRRVGNAGNCLFNLCASCYRRETTCRTVFQTGAIRSFAGMACPSVVRHMNLYRIFGRMIVSVHVDISPTAWQLNRTSCSKRETRHQRDAFRVPMRGAEQRRSAGGSRLALFEPKASLASRPAFPVAQGIPAGDADPGVAFSLATFFWRSKRKYARPQGGKQRQ